MSLSTIKRKELARFLSVGGILVVVDYGIYQMLMSLGMGQNVSKAVSFVCGAFTGFVLNKLWTFSSRRFSKGEALRYVALYSCTAAVNVAVNWAIIKLTAMKTPAYLCATGASATLNFLGQKYFVFRK